MKRRETTLLLITILVIISIITFTLLYYFRLKPVFYFSGTIIFILLLTLLVTRINRNPTSRQELHEQLNGKKVDMPGIFDRVTDAVISLDTGWRFTGMNKRAEEWMVPPGKKPGSFIGQNIFDVLPEAVGSAFHQKAEEAMAVQAYRYVEDHDPRYDRWFENHIYPSPAGFTMLSRDITARKKAEEALRQSEKKYMSLVDTINGVVWESDIKTARLTYLSPQSEQMLGYPVSQWLDDPDFWTRHLYEEDRQMVTDVYRGSIQSKKTHSLEYRMVVADGRVLWLRDIFSVVFENDVPVKWRGITIDVTEQKKMEFSLREAEEKFRNMVERSLVGVYIIQEGRFVYVNPKLAEIYGYGQEEMIRMPVAAMADEEEMLKVNQNIRLRLTGEKDSVHYEIHGKKKDGSYIDVEVYGSKITYKGAPAIIGTLIDITERKKIAEDLRLSEQKYRVMFDNSPMPMFMFRLPDFLIIDANEAAVRQYGYSHEEFLHMTVKDIRPEEDVPAFIKMARSYTDGNLGIWRHKKKNGDIMKAEVFAHSLLYRNQQMRLVSINDVTRQLVDRERLQQSYREIRQLASHIEEVREEEKIKIAREIHDELGQQLTTMKMDASWLYKQPELKGNEALEEKVKGILSMLDEGINTVRRIATELRPGILDDLGLVAAMEWQSQEFEKRSGIKTMFYHDEEEVVLSRNISTGFFRIFQESLTNIARHSQATRVSVYLYKENDGIILKVQDDGKGFDVSAISHKRTLGLLGMKERTMMMGGRYELVSEPGKGTTVMISVKLPPGE
ncbi:MAG: PAS domain S-box protein [Chitinophagaceae bacterium]|nr:PAS domain S-box protein [Chitinophagaceae bacterium]